MDNSQTILDHAVAQRHHKVDQWLAARESALQSEVDFKRTAY